MIASRSVSIWTSNEKSHRNVFSVAFSLSVCRLRKGVCGTGGLVRLNRAGGSSCPGGKFFAEPQRRVAVCGRQKIRRTHGGGQEGRHLRFLPLNSRFPLFLSLAQTRDRRPLRKGERQRIFSTVGEHSVLPCPELSAVPDTILLHRRFTLRRRGISVPRNSFTRCYGQQLRVSFDNRCYHRVR